jgi:hypothetical protein
MAYESLLQNVPIPDANIFRIKGEDDPVTEARQYSELVSSMVPFYNGIPQFDLMLLGLETMVIQHPSFPTGLICSPPDSYSKLQ